MLACWEINWSPGEDESKSTASRIGSAFEPSALRGDSLALLFAPPPLGGATVGDNDDGSSSGAVVAKRLVDAPILYLASKESALVVGGVSLAPTLTVGVE